MEDMVEKDGIYQRMASSRKQEKFTDWKLIEEASRIRLIVIAP